jgi:RNA polymerase subunit RPABC4/transcription elongation factor Spt4
MVVCAYCKHYTDDQGEVCQNCGEPLFAAPLDAGKAITDAQTTIAQLAVDRKRAQLIASSVIAQYAADFYFEGFHQRTVLVDLFGSPLTPERTAAAMLLGGIAFLQQGGYCVLEPGFAWVDVRDWDGQAHSLEGRLARQAGQGKTVYEALQRLIADEMDFRLEVTVGDAEKARFDRFEVVLSTILSAVARIQQQMGRSWGASSSTILQVRSLSARSSTGAIVELGRQAVLPDHDKTAACRQIYRTLLDFIEPDPDRAHQLAEEILLAQLWFQRYAQDPKAALMLG